LPDLTTGMGGVACAEWVVFRRREPIRFYRALQRRNPPAVEFPAFGRLVDHSKMIESVMTGVMVGS
jgi:hypothetical protein